MTSGPQNRAKRRPGQAMRVLGEAVHQLGRVAMLLLVLAVFGICALGFRLSAGPLEIPYLASKLATLASGQGITVNMAQAELAWAGYAQGGGVPLYLKLGGIMFRNGAGVEILEIPSARLVASPGVLFGAGAPILVRATDARFAGSAVPVSLAASIRLGAGYRLASARLTVTLGAGRLGSGAMSVPITGGGFALDLGPVAASLSDGQVFLAPSGASAPHVTFSGQAARQAQWVGTLRVAADAVQAGDLGTYWPAPLLTATRAWVVHNITAGTARAAAFQFSLAAPRDLASLSMTNVAGGFAGQNLTLIWIPHAVPITALNGGFTVLDRETALVTASSGRLGGLVIGPGTMRITGMSERHQFGQLDAAFSGTIPAAMAVIAAPPLSLLAHAPPELAKATGYVTGDVRARIPFLINLQLAAVTLDVGARLDHAALDSPVPGLGLSDAVAHLDVTLHGLSADAKGMVGGEPAALRAQASFDGAANLTLTLNSRAGPVLLHVLGLDAQTMLADPVVGAAPYMLSLTGDPAGAQSAALTADLTPLRLSVPSFGWAKPAGARGTLALGMALEAGDFAAIQSLSVRAAGLNIAGVAAGTTLRLNPADIGGTQAVGFITAPAHAGGIWVAGLSGPVLDVRAMSTPPVKGAKAAPGNAPPTGPAWRLGLNFQALRLAARPAPALADFRFAGRGQGGSLLRAQAAAGGVSATVMALTATRRALLLQAPDAGALLQALNAFNDLRGGALVLNAAYGGAAPMTGTVTLTKFRLLQAPAFAKVLQALTVYGVPAAASGPGLAFGRAVVPFSRDSQTLTLLGARAFSASLGFTASGTINLDDGGANIRATIIPAYALNSLPGKIPVIGHLFTAEKGGGLFAVRANITGTLSDPAVTVNPLSALTPGVLRDVFGAGGSPAK